MNINGTEIQNIDYIRVKQLGCGERYELTFHPPPGGLVNDIAMFVEIDVDLSELERIAKVAPHLLRSWPPPPRQLRPDERKPRRSRAPNISPKGGQ